MDNSSASAIARMLRTQAWERAKGELNSMLHTFHSAACIGTRQNFDDLQEAITCFVEDIESHGLHE